MHSRSRCDLCLQDMVYAAQPYPALLADKVSTLRPPKSLTYNILVVGQARTGKISLVRSLFASFKQDRDFQPRDISKRSVEDFARNPELFKTEVECQDSTGEVAIKYTILVRRLELPFPHVVRCDEGTVACPGMPSSCAMLACWPQDHATSWLLCAAAALCELRVTA